MTSSDVQKNLIESALFMATKPLSLEELMRISGIGSLGYLKETVKSLQKDYSEKGLEIIQTPEGWQMKVKKEYLPNVASLTQHADLSDGCKKTLALVLYHEPLKQSELVKTQGTKAYVYVKELEKRGLLKAERKGHTKLLKIASEFENYFGDTKEEIKKRLVEAMENFDIADSKPEPENENQKTLEEYADTQVDIPFSFLDKQATFLKNKNNKNEKQEITEDDEALPFSFLKKNIHYKKETKKQEAMTTEDDEALEEPQKSKNLKPIKREKPVKIKIKYPKEDKKIKTEEKPAETKPINKVAAKQDLSGIKELTVDDLKK